MQTCRKIAAEQGLRALNMRTVAGECGTALGTLYHYFANKEDLLIAAIGSVWQDIFGLTPEHIQTEREVSFSEYVEQLFRDVQERSLNYPDFFTAHSAAVAGSGKGRAKSAMEHCTGEIRKSLLTVLKRDGSVRPGVFDETLTEERFSEFVLDSIIALVMQNKPCDTLTAVIRKIIY